MFRRLYPRAVRLRWRVPGYSYDPIVRQTNEEGRFLFTNLSPGEWELSADRRGFVPGNYGASKYAPQGSRISVKANQQIEDLVLRLNPQAVIAGRVLDVEGEPVEGARVAILKGGYVNGVPRWSEVASATTLDNGEYRIPRVPAGRYLVRCTAAEIARAPSSSGAETAYAAAYHPNVAERSSAAVVEVQDGSEIRGIDIRLAATGVFHVRGRFPTTDRLGIVQLVDRANPSKVLAQFAANPPEYLIDFPRVPPGSYTAFGWTMEGNVFRASQPVDVIDQDVDSLVLSPAPAGEIQGSVKLKSAARQVDLKTLAVVFLPIWLDGKGPGYVIQPVKIGDDLKFQYWISGLSASRFTSFAVTVSRFPEGCYLTSVRYGGKDVSDSEIEYSNGATLEITIAADGARVDGNALDKDDNPVEGAVVALIPKDGKSAPRSSTSGPRGAFHIAGVPPGEYKLLAWDDIGRDDLENPDLMKRFDSQSKAVKLLPSETASVSIRLADTGIADERRLP
jgi:hypothetical protein